MSATSPPSSSQDTKGLPSIHAKTHQLYHEAQRRASGRQPVVKYSTPKSLLLLAPNNVIFELFNTVVEEWPSEKLLEFVTSALREYLEVNWTSKIIQQMIRRLRREQAVDFKAGLHDIPIIRSSSALSFKTQKSETNSKGQRHPNASTSSPQRSPPIDYNEHTSKSSVINQIYEHLMWRVKSNNVTQITSLIVKLMIDDGYKRGKLRAEVYEDVVESFEDWRAKKLIKLYSFGDAPPNDQKLILTSTTGGDLTKWVANFIDGSEKRQNPDLIRKLATALRDRTKNCIYVTCHPNDAIRAYETGALRCVIIVDRLKSYEKCRSSPELKVKLDPLIESGKIYVVDNLCCIEFAPDPTSDNCC